MSIRRTFIRSVDATIPAALGAARSTKEADAHERRKMVADFCKLIGAKLGTNPVGPTSDSTPSQGVPAATARRPNFDNIDLSPRMRQTLDRLLAGDSEKQIAARLELSRHTVHVYVKALYKAFTVNSRGELLARFIDNKPAAPSVSGC